MAFIGQVIEHIEAGKNIRCIERPPEPHERGIVKISAVSWGRFNELESKTVLPGAQLDERARISPGDLLISRANTIELVGACARVDALTRRLYLSDKVLRLRAAPEVLPWLHRYLSSPEARTALSHSSSGNQLSMRNISQVTLNSLPVPLAPVNEQNRICRKLDMVLARIGTCRERLNRVPPILKKFREAVLEAAVSGRLTEEWRTATKLNLSDWASGPFSLLLAGTDGAIRRGPFGSTIKKSLFVPKGYKVYEQANAIKNDCSLGSYYISKELYNQLDSFHVAGGHFIVSCAGTIGRIAEVPAGSPVGVINQALMRIRIDPAVVSARFFLLFFRSPSFQRAILEKTQGGAMQNLAPIKTVKSLAVSVPSLAEQNEIVRRVDDLVALADSIQRGYDDAFDCAEKLTPSVLAKAFRGELVSQDPNDEPAETLLGRIRQAKSRVDAAARNAALVDKSELRGNV